MKKTFIILSIIISIIYLYKEKEEIKIPTNSIRIRIIANSNSIKDQVTKVKVKQSIESNLYSKLNNVANINEARSIIKHDINNLDLIVKNIVGENNYNINYGKNYFPKKEMYGINYEAGNYESLIVNLGNGQGKNWWCVLFPPICMIDSKNNDTNNVEYKSKVLEILNHYK